MYQIVLGILNWYKNNFRDLPWRNTQDPYKIWLSEIILQQTQVQQGWAYYEKFIEFYPTVSDLAAANEENILKLWQGLGYYSRARNLHKTAKVIESDYNGFFPQEYPELLKLPGIGEYTAAAIASFAYNKRYPVLDGNVFRFLSRLYNIDLPIDEAKNRKVFLNILDEMIGDHSPSAFNNAMMEMGAMICKPANPLCAECPVAQSCQALKLGKINLLPVKGKKLKVKTRYFNFIHFDYQDGFYIEQRTQKDIWHNLFQLPLIETAGQTDSSGIQTLLEGIMRPGKEFSIVHKMHAKHLLTHQVLQTDFWYIKLREKPVFMNKDMRFVTLNNHKIYAIPKLIDNYLLLL